MRILLATAALVGTLGLATKTSCAVADGHRWFSTSPVPAGTSYARLCASELPGEYATTGLAEGVLPWSRDDGRWPVNAVPLPIGALQYASASVVHLLAQPDLDARSSMDAVRVEVADDVRREAVAYTGLVALLSLVALLVSLVVLARASVRSRTHDALRPWPSWGAPAAALMPLAASPLVALLIGVGWDLVGVALMSIGLAAWTAGRARTAGVVLGIAVLTAWWPLAVLLPLIATALLRHARAAGRLVVTSVLTLVVGGAVAAVTTSGAAVGTGVQRWLYREDGVGSIWAALREMGFDPSPQVVAAIVIAVCAFAASMTFVSASRSGDVAQTARFAFVLLAVMLLVSTTYAPGYALWLLPLAVLARPVWRDLLVWQAVEVFLVVATWWHLGQSTQPVGEATDVVYVVAIAAHVAATIWLAVRMTLVVGDSGADASGASAPGSSGIPSPEEPHVLHELRR
ncbi:hypothetical protein FE697_002655 [Mumia zhuanghuii]|uniref:Alpha-1,2-mannosyltransferase n=2 Tax=Mumia TaxID=1546255 RepID=A0ABW1QJ49_9ACTN|nr:MULTISPECIES: hypothetical protein [Mumia]KAA1424832.1 hypothetical protein FE697_002655 [Mumia zhuanghuii]